jgi:hypothetical protein
MGEWQPCSVWLPAETGFICIARAKLGNFSGQRMAVMVRFTAKTTDTQLFLVHDEKRSNSCGNCKCLVSFVLTPVLVEHT